MDEGMTMMMEMEVVEERVVIWAGAVTRRGGRSSAWTEGHGQAHRNETREC